jgi:hypothetical protein
MKQSKAFDPPAERFGMTITNDQAVQLIKNALTAADFRPVKYAQARRDSQPGFYVAEANGGVRVMYGTGDRPKSCQREALVARLTEYRPCIERALGPDWTVHLISRTKWTPHIFAIKE